MNPKKSLSLMVHSERIYRLQKFIPLLIIIAISLIPALLSLRNIQLGQPADDAIYIDLANSISQGHGIRHISLVKTPPETWFPIGWPLILSILLKFLPGNFEATHYLTLFFVLLGILFVYAIIGLYVDRPLQIAITALYAFSPMIVLSAGSPMSEPAYIVFSMLSLYLLEKSLSKKRYRLWLIMLLAVTIAFSIMIRSIGYTLLAAAVLWLFWKRRPGMAVLLGMLVFLLLLPQFYINHQAGGGAISSSYQGSIDTSLTNIKTNLVGYISMPLPNLLIPILGTKFGNDLSRMKWFSWSLIIFQLVSILLLLTGFLIEIRKLKSFHFYTISFMLLTLVYKNPISGSVQSRYLVPILPFLLLYLLQGIIYYWNVVFSNKTGKLQKKPAPLYMIMAFLLLGYSLFIFKDIGSPLYKRMTDLQAGAVWISQNTPANSIVMSRDPISRYLYTRRTMTDFIEADTLEEFKSKLNQMNVSYILVSPSLNGSGDTSLDDYLSRKVQTWLQNNQLYFRKIYRDQNNNVTVFEFLNK